MIDRDLAMFAAGMVAAVHLRRAGHDDESIRGAALAIRRRAKISSYEADDIIALLNHLADLAFNLASKSRQ